MAMGQCAGNNEPHSTKSVLDNGRIPLPIRVVCVVYAVKNGSGVGLPYGRVLQSADQDKRITQGTSKIDAAHKRRVFHVYTKEDVETCLKKLFFDR